MTEAKFFSWHHYNNYEFAYQTFYKQYVPQIRSKYIDPFMIENPGTSISIWIPHPTNIPSKLIRMKKRTASSQHVHLFCFIPAASDVTTATSNLLSVEFPGEESGSNKSFDQVCIPLTTDEVAPLVILVDSIKNDQLSSKFLGFYGGSRKKEREPVYYYSSDKASILAILFKFFPRDNFRYLVK